MQDRLRLFVLACTLATQLGCASDSPPCPDATFADAGPSPCPPPLVDEGDACVGWRAIPPPPCAPAAMVRVEGQLGVRCVEGLDYVLTPSATWEWTTAVSTLEMPSSERAPDVGLSQQIVVTLADGARVATHGDVYASPAAWRRPSGAAWRETVPPPSAFLALGGALSDHEALFVGRDAFVFTLLAR